MSSDQGRGRCRLAGCRPLALTILLSLSLQVLMLSLVDWSWPGPSGTDEPATRLELRLRPPQQRQRSEAVTTSSDIVAESQPAPPQPSPEELPETQPGPDPATPQQNPALDFDTLVKETVETLEGDEPRNPLGVRGPTVGDSAFDPRLRERIRQSEDINTVAPAKRARVRSWQEPGGDLYVEVGDGGCFKVRESWEAGVPATWEFTRCRSKGERLKLNPKPYADLD